MGDKKYIIGITIITLVILVGGVFWATRSQTSTPSQTQKVPKELIQKLEVTETDWVKGPSSASATLIEYGDFQCPACASYHQLVNQLLPEFSHDLRFVFRHFPLNQHPNARPAIYAAEAAGIQNKFWEMYDKLFENQSNWSSEKDSKKLFVSYAKDLGLNTEKFSQDYELQSIKDNIQSSVTEGSQLGVNSTPTFYLNGEKLQNPGSYEDFATLVKAAIKKAPVSQAPEEKYHTHFNLKVVLASGQAVDFTQKKYQSIEGKELSPDIHLHDGVGDVVHIHKKGMSLGDLFKSLKITLTKDCLALDTGEKFCNSENQKLRIFINGKEGKSFDTYQPKDIDRVLLVYGDPKENVDALITTVADNACIYSETCPQRGTPPTEECVGGLGTDCEE